MESLILVFAALVLFAALLIFWIAGNQRRSTGLPAGRVTYIDTDQLSRVEKPLYDPISGLTGKPDYLVEEKDNLIPVEVKSRRAPNLPYDSHIYQLAAYCLLVERTYGKRPPYGILHYSDRTFSIDYTPELESELVELLDAMRFQERVGDPDRSHNEAARCARCGFRDYCDQRL